MHFSSWALCFWLLATPAPQVLSVQIQYDITGSGGVMEAAKDPTLVNLDFGGIKHGVDRQGDHMRPEAVKTQVCEEPSSRCSDCTTKSSCWRGSDDSSAITQSGEPKTDSNKLGSLKLDVSASATANYYAAEVWASCGSGNGKWTLTVWRDTIVNGVLEIFVDGVRRKTFTRGEGRVGKGRVRKDGKKHFAVAKNTRVRVLFKRITAGQVASAQVKLKAVGVDEYVDSCMGVTNCLEGLGDGSDSAFDFRNSNKKQLQCLKATTFRQRFKVSRLCNGWNKCLTKSGIEKKLKALLGASLTLRVSLAEGKVNMGEGRGGKGGEEETGRPGKGYTGQELKDAKDCVDPSVEDAESWYCECVDKMTESCKGVDGTLEECFRSLVCGNNNVCESWKRGHCDEVLLAKASQNKSAALTRPGAKRAIANVGPDASILISHRIKVEENVGDSLDNSLRGKCNV